MTEATVRKLHPEAGELRPAPALGMSVVMNMPGDRQATLQCFVAQEDGEEAANELLDRMFRVADRQRARYELVDLEDQLEKHERELFNFEEQFARVEKEHARRKVEKEEEIVARQEEIDSIRADGYEKWTKSGRQGEYEPQGGTKQSIEVKRAAVKQAKAEIDKMDAERAQELAGIGESKARFNREILRIKKEIVKRKKMLGGE